MRVDIMGTPRKNRLNILTGPIVRPAASCRIVRSFRKRVAQRNRCEVPRSSCAAACIPAFECNAKIPPAGFMPM
jgi:hypothetical protein